MSELRGIAGCPECKVPWIVEDWATYLSVKCPQCGRKLGEVASTTPVVQIVGQQLPMGISPQTSVVVLPYPETEEEDNDERGQHSGSDEG